MAEAEPAGLHRARIWLARVDQVSPAALLDCLDRSERERLARFACPAERQRRFVAWTLRRLALSQACPAIAPADWRFTAGPSGKPELAEPFAALRLSHNLSHGGAYAAVMVARQACGIDVEPLPRELVALAEVLTPREEREVRASLLPAQRFQIYWTAKEAVLKMLGTGLILPPRQLGITIAADERTARVSMVAPSVPSVPAGLQLRLWTLPDGYRLAACSAASAAPIRLEGWPWPPEAGSAPPGP